MRQCFTLIVHVTGCPSGLIHILATRRRQPAQSTPGPREFEAASGSPNVLNRSKRPKTKSPIQDTYPALMGVFYPGNWKVCRKSWVPSLDSVWAKPMARRLPTSAVLSVTHQWLLPPLEAPCATVSLSHTIVWRSVNHVFRMINTAPIIPKISQKKVARQKNRNCSFVSSWELQSPGL